MTTGEIEERVRNVVVESLGAEPEDITLEANITEDLGADSLDVVELIIAIEGEFEIEIPDEDADGIRTVRDIVEYIHSNKM